MSAKSDKVRVCFRRDRADPRSSVPVAAFVDCRRPGLFPFVSMVKVYTAEGGYFECSVDWLYRSKPADPERCATLAAELRDHGHTELCELQRLPPRRHMESGFDDIVPLGGHSAD